MIALLRVTTSESMSPRPCFPILKTPFIYCFTACLLAAIFISDCYYRLMLSTMPESLVVRGDVGKPQEQGVMSKQQVFPQ